MEGAEWNEVPAKFEAGTPAIVEAIGLGAAIDYLTDLGMDNVREHERYLFEPPGRRWARFPACAGLGPDDPEIHAGVISFVLDEVHPHDVATIFDHEGVAVRAGHHCAQPVMLRYDIPATTRASFYVYNDLDDVARPGRCGASHAADSSRADAWTTCTATSSSSTTATPTTRGCCDPHDLHFADSNPTCGDEMSMTLRPGRREERHRRCRLRRARLRHQPGIGLDPDR